MAIATLIAELKRRRVFRVIVGYGVVSFGLLQVVEPIMHALHLPDSVLTYCVVGLAFGFPVAVVLAWAFDVNAGAIERTPAAPGSFALRGPRLALVLVGIGLVAALPVVYLGVHGGAHPASPADDEAFKARLDAVPPGSQSRALPSIAVLPFVNLSSDKEQEYFSDGLSEELLNLLAQLPQLRVIARTSSFSFKGKNVDLATIAKALDVASVLDGSVRKSGSKLRVTAQLIRAADSSHLWSQTYDRELTDVFKVQDEIASAVVAALKIKLLPTEHVANQRRTLNTEAYTQYLLGNQFRVRDTPEANQQAIAAYQKAVVLDPDYAAAFSGLAVAEWRLADQSTAESAGYQRAAVAADRAIALAPASPDGYWARGALRHLYYFDWSGAQADFDKALKLDPNDVRTLASYGRLLATLGRLPDAIAMTRKAISLDPLSADAWEWLSQYLLGSGQLAAAREAAKRVHDIKPEGADTGWAIELLADRPTATLAALPEYSRESALLAITLAEHKLGHAAQSQKALDQLIKDNADTWAYQIAEVYAWRGEKDRAFDWLERAYRQHDGGLTGLVRDPFLASLRGDPRYTALLKKMQLPLD